MAKKLEEAGDFEGAREALGDLWKRVGERPSVEGLAARDAAEVLQQVGRLTSILGSAKQVEGAQEYAKNLISESAMAFERLGDMRKVAEARSDLGFCYWYEGSYDEARVVLKDALSRFSDSDVDLKAAALLRLAIVERSANRYDAAFELLGEAAPLVESSVSNLLKGSFHNLRATTLENLARAEGRKEKFDDALIEYAAASYHLEMAGNARNLARVENNLGFLYRVLGRYEEAHKHLARAREVFDGLKDVGNVAQVDETRALVFLDEGRYAEAERAARSAARSLEAGGQSSLFAAALTTRGVALARSGRGAEARLNFLRAVETAEQAGDVEGAGQAALALAEELSDQMTAREMRDVYVHASGLLSKSQNPSTLARLNECGLRVVEALHSSKATGLAPEGEGSAEEKWAGFSLKREVLRYEGELIERALLDAGGVVSRASKMLGFSHHQTFVALLNNRHKSLLHARKPIIPRKRSIVRVSAPSRTAQHRADKGSRAVSILFVEDNRLVAEAVRDTLEFEGWRVESCHDGGAALKLVEGREHFDLLLFDEDLPGLNGTELTRRARRLAHRRDTPVVIVSANNCEAAARAAGANVFLKKPQDILTLVPTISRLLGLDATTRQDGAPATREGVEGA